MRTVKYGVVAVAIITIMAVNVQSAFIVEALPGGLANANFTGNPSISTGFPLGSDAYGCVSTNGVFGQIDAPPDVYVFSYTPGTDTDNTTIAAGRDLGNGDMASGLEGGSPGSYNVYATWCTSSNVNPLGCYFTVTSDGADTVTDTINQNAPGSTGTDKWMLIAEGVTLTEGLTYTITQTANGTDFVSMRSHGVMWELVEPDYAPVTITESGDSTDVIEGDTWDSYDVVLDQEPTCDFVYVTANPIREIGDPNNILFVLGEDRVIGPVTLTFTPDDWDIPQTVYVEAEDDDLVELDHHVLIRHSTEPNNVNPLDPPDLAFVGGFAGYVKVNITDNDGPDIRIVETDLATDVSEQGATDTYDVEILYPPTADVTITIDASGDGETAVDVGSGPVATAQLVFTTLNWTTPQTVTVSAIDDAYLELVHTGTITHSVSSTDAGYNLLPVDSVTVYIEDNECGGWGYEAMDFDKNCVVNLSDFAVFASEWMVCTQPYGSYCIDLQ